MPTPARVVLVVAVALPADGASAGLADAVSPELKRAEVLAVWLPWG